MKNQRPMWLEYEFPESLPIGFQEETLIPCLYLCALTELMAAGKRNERKCLPQGIPTAD